MTFRDLFSEQEGESPLCCAKHGTWSSLVAAPRFFICTGNMRGKWAPGSLGHTEVTQQGEPLWGQVPGGRGVPPEFLPSALAAVLGAHLSELEEERLKSHTVTQSTAP